MVTDAIIDWFFAAVTYILNLLPTVTVPAWLTAVSTFTATILGYATSMGAWFPTTLAATVLAAVLAANGIGMGIKVVRIVASFFTAGGGSAA